MISLKRFYLIAVGFGVVGWGSVAFGESDVTVISNSPNSSVESHKNADSDGTPVVHKSSHKKKRAIASNPAPSPAPPTYYPASVVTPPPIVVTKSPALYPPPTVLVQPKSTIFPGTATPSLPAPSTPSGTGPTVETGLPVARYPGMGAPIRGVSTYSPSTGTLAPVKPITGTHLPYFASAITTPVIPLTATTPGIYSSPKPSSSSADFNFINYGKKYKNVYPWKTNIVTTEFWIGEGSTPISRTDNIASSWDEDWRANNHGTDSPNNRNGYAAGSHASTLNPFYVALPFNDLAFPDKARRWLPSGWYRRPKDGKQVSACKDRWVEIKNGKGDVCYAQWEDVGPLRYDHAEYVFGSERPIGLGDDHAGLDVSPAVADYLNINDRNRYTSWRFVDDEDVRPGAWLKLDEQAVLYTALHQLKSSTRTTVDLPIQKASEPIEDSPEIDADKKKVSASKG